MKHTPGPWFINGPFDHDNDLFIRTSIDGENFDIANLSCDETEDTKANASLIAAAPDLLAALEFIVNDLIAPGEDAHLSVDGYNKACAAIKKAKGE